MMPRAVNSNPEPGPVSAVSALLRDNGLPRLEVSMLIAYVLGCPRVSVLAHPERRLQPDDAVRYAELRRRRLAGEPIAYLTGTRDFHGLQLRVTADVLIPRPETEELVAAALQRLPRDQAVRVLDLGTGSGAVAIAIATERPAAIVLAVDVSPDALAVAARNARELGTPNVRCAVSDWFSSCHGRFAVIVSNPPYIAAADAHLSQGDLRFEPRIALTPGPDGAEALQAIIAEARRFLEPGGWLFLEHGYDQADRCRKLLGQGGLVDVASRRDLAGIERVSGGRAPL